MTEFTANFESGIDGNDILTSDTGSATAWTEKSVGGTTTMRYSSAQKYGALGAMIITDSTPSAAHMGWTPLTFGAGFATTYGRIHLFLPAAHNTTAILVRGFDASALAWDLLILSTNLLKMRDAAGTDKAVGAVTVSLNQWVRIEWKAVSSLTDGLLEYKLFNNPDSTTPSETITSSGSFSTRTKTDQMRVGILQFGKASTTYYFDNILANDTGYAGPFIAPTPANTIFRTGRGSAW